MKSSKSDRTKPETVVDESVPPSLHTECSSGKSSRSESVVRSGKSLHRSHSGSSGKLSSKLSSLSAKGKPSSARMTELKEETEVSIATQKSAETQKVSKGTPANTPETLTNQEGYLNQTQESLLNQETDHMATITESMEPKEDMATKDTELVAMETTDYIARYSTLADGCSTCCLHDVYAESVFIV